MVWTVFDARLQLRQVGAEEARQVKCLYKHWPWQLIYTRRTVLPMLVSDPDLTSLLPLPGDDVSGTSCSDRCPPLPWSDKAALLTLTLPLEWVGYSRVFWVR